jgi:hypothetical protein
MTTTGTPNLLSRLPVNQLVCIPRRMEQRRKKNATENRSNSHERTRCYPNAAQCAVIRDQAHPSRDNGADAAGLAPGAFCLQHPAVALHLRHRCGPSPGSSPGRQGVSDVSQVRFVDYAGSTSKSMEFIGAKDKLGAGSTVANAPMFSPTTLRRGIRAFGAGSRTGLGHQSCSSSTREHVTGW